MGFFRKTPEEKEEKRKENFSKYKKQMDKILLENDNLENSNSDRVIFFNTELNNLVKTAKTKEEYEICSSLFKRWFKYTIGVFKIDTSDISFKNMLKGFGITRITLDKWNSFIATLYDGFYSLIVSGNYEDVVNFVDDFFSIREIIMNKPIMRDYVGQKLVYDKNAPFVTVSLYCGFAKYKLNKFDEALEIFNAFSDYSINYEIDENDYAREIFSEYDYRINSKKFIEIIENM